MKPFLLTLVAAASLPLLTPSASAALLLTDDFTVTSNSQNVNQELAGRLGGSMAAEYISSGTAYLLGGEHHQVGNTTTNVGQVGGAANGNFVLVAHGGSFQSVLDIAGAANAANQPIAIRFDMYQSSTANAGGNLTNWGAFTLRSAGGGNGFPIAGDGEFGVLRRTNGGIQAFQGGNPDVTPAGYDVPGFTDTDSSYWQWTFTDTAGTGSAFNGNGSVAHWVNGDDSGSIPLGQLNDSGLFVGFGNTQDRFVGIDNLSIETIPEPGSVVLLSFGVGFLMLRRRSRGI